MKWKVVNLGIQYFYDALKMQECDAVQVLSLIHIFTIGEFKTIVSEKSEIVMC